MDAKSEKREGQPERSGYRSIEPKKIRSIIVPKGAEVFGQPGRWDSCFGTLGKCLFLTEEEGAKIGWNPPDRLTIEGVNWYSFPFTKICRDNGNEFEAEETGWIGARKRRGKKPLQFLAKTEEGFVLGPPPKEKSKKQPVAEQSRFVISEEPVLVGKNGKEL